jgi:hypothetical protein
MARIETYNLAASPIAGADKLIGTDSNNNNDTKNFSVQEVSDFVKPYNVYVALLTQSGTNPPTAIVLENTIGNIYWTYDDEGIYKGYSALFNINKTVFLSQNSPYVSTSMGSGVAVILSLYGDGQLANYSIEIRVYQ